jgi:DNA mismatch repair protein MSH3
VLLPAFNKIAKAFDDVQKPEYIGFESHVLNEIIFSLPKLKVPLEDILRAVHLEEAAKGKKDQMWRDLNKYRIVSELHEVEHVPLSSTFNIDNFIRQGNLSLPRLKMS